MWKQEKNIWKDYNILNIFKPDSEKLKQSMGFKGLNIQLDFVITITLPLVHDWEEHDWSSLSSNNLVNGAWMNGCKQMILVYFKHLPDKASQITQQKIPLSEYDQTIVYFIQ